MKIKFWVKFFDYIIPHLVSFIESSLYALLHCQLLFYFSNRNHVAWFVNNCSTIQYLQQTLENQILVAAKLKYPRKLQETHVWRNLCKAPIVLLHEVYRLCCCKHCWLRASRMLSALLSASSSNFNWPKKFRTFDFRVWILSLQIYNIISVSQTQIGENVVKLNNFESYILTGSYRQLSTQSSGKVIINKV